jgi:Rieske Fe-S protein
MQRREFIGNSCRACLLGAAGFLVPQWMGCSPATFPVYKTPVTSRGLEVPISLFDKSPLQFVRAHGSYFDIAVNRLADGTFQALLLQCTHQENQLTPTGDGYTCSLHGSRFDKNGEVLKGPAEHPLDRYKTRVENNLLIIQTTNT